MRISKEINLSPSLYISVTNQYLFAVLNIILSIIHVNRGILNRKLKCSFYLNTRILELP